MKHVKLFEEYRLFRGRREFHPMGDTWYPKRPNVKDPNEPFFMKAKNRYHKGIFHEEERARMAEKRIRDLELARRQEPMMREFIEKIRNHPETIVKTKYKEQNGDLKYGIIMNDGTKINVSQDYWDNGDPMDLALSINGDYMVNVKEQRGNPAVDRLGEEDWNDDPTLVDVLGKLIIDHVLKNEIVL